LPLPNPPTSRGRLSPKREGLRTFQILNNFSMSGINSVLNKDKVVKSLPPGGEPAPQSGGFRERS